MDSLLERKVVAAANYYPGKTEIGSSHTWELSTAGSLVWAVIIVAPPNIL